MAVVVACALALLHTGPLWAGASFLVIGFGIALGAVAGHYHYAADAILGLLTAAAAWLAGIGFDTNGELRAGPVRIPCALID